MGELRSLSDEYLSLDIADHYAAYRPPLHPHILKKIMTGNNYGQGLDVGSGTGQSTLALLPFCDHVYGVEPSPAMLARAHQHDCIDYLHYDGITLPINSHSVALITFAGSWFYAKSQAFLDELIRVSRKGTILLMYDYKVVLDQLQFVFEKLPNANLYNHSEDLSGLNSGGYVWRRNYADTYELEIKAANLAHLVLAEKINMDALRSKYKTNQPYEPLRAEIEERLGEELRLKADVFATQYVYGEVS